MTTSKVLASCCFLKRLTKAERGTANECDLTFVCIANEVFDQAAHFSHLLLTRGQRGRGDVGFTRLQDLGLFLDVTLQEPDMGKKTIKGLYTKYKNNS